MNNIILYLDNLKKERYIEDEKYLYYFLIHSIAPTIDNLKPSHVIAFKSTKNFDYYNMWAIHEKSLTLELNKLGIKVKQMYKSSELIHVLFYKEKLLSDYLNEQENISFLERFGYLKSMSLNEKLNLLKDRYEKPCPHEIGLFLGYFLEDVIDFVDNNNCKECLFKGYWKVYNNEKKAKEIFTLFDNSKTKCFININKDLNRYLCS